MGAFMNSSFFRRMVNLYLEPLVNEFSTLNSSCSPLSCARICQAYQLVQFSSFFEEIPAHSKKILRFSRVQIISLSEFIIGLEMRFCFAHDLLIYYSAPDPSTNSFEKLKVKMLMPSSWKVKIMLDSFYLLIWKKL